MCRRQISKGIFTSAGKHVESCRWRHGKTTELIMWFWSVFKGFLVQGSLMAKISGSLHIHLSDMCFPTGTRPDLDIEQRITPIERFLGSLIYI